MRAAAAIVALAVTLFAGLMTMSRGGAAAMFLAALLTVTALYRVKSLGKRFVAALACVFVLIGVSLVIHGYQQSGRPPGRLRSGFDRRTRSQRCASGDLGRRFSGLERLLAVRRRRGQPPRDLSHVFDGALGSRIHTRRKRLSASGARNRPARPGAADGRHRHVLDAGAAAVCGGPTTVEFIWPAPRSRRGSWPASCIRWPISSGTSRR